MKPLFYLCISVLSIIQVAQASQAHIDACWACTSKEYLDDMTRYISNHDNESMNRYILTGKCYLIDNQTVYVVDRGFLTTKIDWRGEKLYVVSECIR